MRELEKILLEDPYSMDKQNKDIFFLCSKGIA